MAHAVRIALLAVTFISWAYICFANTITFNDTEIQYDQVKRVPSGTTIHIENTPGGGQRALWKLRNYKVVISGECVSACVWLLLTSRRACYTETATFYAHSWHKEMMVSYTLHIQSINFAISAKTKLWRRDVDLTKLYLFRVREPLRTRLATLVTTSRLIAIPMELMSQVYPDKLCR